MSDEEFNSEDMLTSILCMVEMVNYRMRKDGKSAGWRLVTTDGGRSCIIRHNESGESFRVTVTPTKE